MRKVRGADNLASYLKSPEVNVPISSRTIFRLVRNSAIPFHRPAPRVLIFDLDEIDAWLGGDGDV